VPLYRRAPPVLNPLQPTVAADLEQLLEEAIALSVKAKGGDSRVAAHYRANLARVHLAKGDAATAEPLFRQSLAVRLRAFSEHDWRVAMTKSQLGEALTALRRYSEAEPLLLDAQRILKDLPGPQGREAKATLIRLRALYQSWGRRGNLKYEVKSQKYEVKNS
jgi:tetratricopeptide (TPR) repeat protein